MRPTLRSGISTYVMVTALAGVGVGCDWLPREDRPGFPGAPPSSEPRADAAPVVIPDARAVSDTGAGTDTSALDAGTETTPDGLEDPAYDAMCLHYCETLQETVLLYCISSGRDRATCMASAVPVATCFDDRCRPHRVDQALCLRQCDALAVDYAAVCPVAGDPSDSLCLSSRADHAAACRAGCGS